MSGAGGAEGAVARCAVQPAAARAQSGSFGTQVRAPRLEIKKDAKGMVTVPGAPASTMMPHHSLCLLAVLIQISYLFI